MDYHPVVAKILDQLKKNNFWHETFEHETVRTSEEAAKVRSGYTLNQGAKAIIVRVKEKSGNKYFLMLVLPADQKINIDKLKIDLDAKDIRFASEDEVLELTGGVKPGGVPPFGNLFGLKVIADPTLFENTKIIFNAGDRRFSVAMISGDYKTLVDPQITPII